MRGAVNLVSHTFGLNADKLRVKHNYPVEKFFSHGGLLWQWGAICHGTFGTG